MTDYIQLSAPPQFCIQYPTCSGCCVDLDNDGDSWTCPSCGTSWGMDANDGEQGTLYADWSGEESTGPRVSEEDAHRWGYYHERMEQHRSFPDLVPEPKRPTPTPTHTHDGVRLGYQVRICHVETGGEAAC